MSLDWLTFGIPYGWLVVPVAHNRYLRGGPDDGETSRPPGPQRFADPIGVRPFPPPEPADRTLPAPAFSLPSTGAFAPARPASTFPPSVEEEEDDPSWKSRWLKKLPWRKPRTTLTQGSTGSAGAIVGRHSFSVGYSVVWRTTGAYIIRVVQPVGARLIQPVGSRALTVAPRLVALGGGAASTGGSVAAATTVRAVVGTISVVGWVIGPALAAWTVTSEARKINKARRDLAILLARQDMEMAGFRVRNRRLEARYAEVFRATEEEKELVATG